VPEVALVVLGVKQGLPFDVFSAEVLEIEQLLIIADHL